MTRALTIKPFESADLEVNSAFSVVIVYEDFETGKHAAGFLIFPHEGRLGRDHFLVDELLHGLLLPRGRILPRRSAAAG